MGLTLLDILACPVCKSPVDRQTEHLLCARCGRRYPLAGRVPVMLPEADTLDREALYDQPVHTREDYDGWLHRHVLESLDTGQIILDCGAGTIKRDRPNVIRMDVTLTPYKAAPCTFWSRSVPTYAGGDHKASELHDPT